MSNDNPLLLTQNGFNWKQYLDFDADGLIGYTYYAAASGWPGYVHNGSNFTTGYAHSISKRNKAVLKTAR